LPAGFNIVVRYLSPARFEVSGSYCRGLVPPSSVAARLALIVTPGDAAPVANVAGVAALLVGADLLHLRGIEQSAVGMASIGGAGTFDSIALSVIVAAFLA